MNASPSTWRLRWRSVGLGVDKLLPLAYAFPVPSAAGLRELVPSVVVVPDEGRNRLTDVDKEVVADSTMFVVDFVASLPVQVAATELKP